MVAWSSTAFTPQHAGPHPVGKHAQASTGCKDAASEKLQLRAVSPTAVASDDNAAPGGTPPDEPAQDEPAPDDGRALDPAGPAGFVGVAVVGIAVLPYVPVSLYSSYLLATTGRGVEPGPNGIYGLAEGFATITILGVALWSLLSLITRGRGLPPGPFNVLGLAQGLSCFCSVFFAFAVWLNTLEPDDNPFRGLSLTSSATELQKAAQKAEKTIVKTGNIVFDATAGPRAFVTGVLKDAESDASRSFELPKIEVRTPDFINEFKPPEFKVPEFKAPEFKAPDLKVPEIKAPELKTPNFKAPEVKVNTPAVPDVKAPVAKEPAVKVPDAGTPASTSSQASTTKDYGDLFGA